MNPAWHCVISYELILAVLRTQCTVAVWRGVMTKIKLEEGPKHGLHLSLYSQPS